MRVLHKDPLVVEFTDFVSQEEIDALIGMALWQYRQPSWFDHATCIMLTMADSSCLLAGLHG